jgi:hypothetical protein
VATGHKKITALRIIGCVLSLTLGNASPTHAAPAATPAPAAAVVVVPERPVAKSAPAKAEAKSEAAPKKRTLRKIKSSEMTVPVVKMARQIINEHYKDEFGTEIDFELGGKHFVGRIEHHYHPPGGELHPWGPHKGCSLYVVEDAG